MAGEDAAATAINRFQDRLPASLYEIAWQYSVLDWFGTTGTSDIDWDLAPEHLAYLTPLEKSNLFDEDDSLIIVYADLSDPDNPVLRDDTLGGPVKITTYTEQDRFRVGHSYPPGKSSTVTDYSITTFKSADAHHIAGLREDAWWTNNVQDRFTEWPQTEFADRVRENAEPFDAAILDGLATLGNDDETMEELSDAFLALTDSEDQKFSALITVAVKAPKSDEYKLPGEIDVLNDVMREKKATRLENISVKDASDDGVDYVTGFPERVTGGSSGLFGMYTVKQREHIPNLDKKGTDAWRIRSLDFDIAAAIEVAGSLFDGFYRGLGNNRRLYVLPYLAARKTDLDPETFEWFYEEVYRRLQSTERGPDGTFDDVLETIMLESARLADPNVEEPETEEPLLFGQRGAEDWDSVRFAVVHQVTGNPDRVLFDTLDGLAFAAAVNDAHNEVTASKQFEGDGIFAGSPSPESSFLLGRSLSLARQITYGYYFERTTEALRTRPQGGDRPDAGAMDDSRMERVRNLLTGTRINGVELFEQYINHLVRRQRIQFGSDDPYIPFPNRGVVEQYVQLRALAGADAIDTTDTISLETTTMTDESEQIPREFENRTDRLDTFIEEHAALSGEAEQAVFVLGGLVGRISAYQSHPTNDISSTLIRRYPIDYLTPQTIKEVTKEVLQMNNSYAEASSDRSYYTNSRYYTRLPGAMLTADPSEWRLSESELQWVYSLGIAYGLSDGSIDTEGGEEQESDEDPSESITIQ